MKAVHRLSRVIALKMGDDLFAGLNVVRCANGFTCLSPIAVRSLRKLKALVRREMDEVSALEIQLPSLADAQLFEKSGRYGLPDLFKLETSPRERYVLNPTCEEAVTDLVASAKSVSYSHLPLRLYQIGSKFRNEKRPKSGLLRAKEFVMKDLYCFDESLEESQATYREVLEKYDSLFQSLGIPYLSVNGSNAGMGGLTSTEFHFLSKVGDDSLVSCLDCGHKQNCELSPKDAQECQNCHGGNVEVVKGIEVGHAFQLGTHYTEKLEAVYRDRESKPVHAHMSCFGLGLTRILAASVEVLSDGRRLRWPMPIAPYSLALLPPKMGSKEEKVAERYADSIFGDLVRVLDGDVVVDDRPSMTIGKRLVDVDALGIPFAVVMGKEMAADPVRVEFHDLYRSEVSLLQVGDLAGFVRDVVLDRAGDRLGGERRDACTVRTNT